MDRRAGRTLRLLLALALAVAAVLVNQTPAAACSCRAQTAAQALRTADAVFRGTVTEQTPVKQTRIDFRVQVDAVYKGTVFADQVVATAPTGASCGQNIEIGSRWVIFALEGTEGDGNNAVTRLITDSCSGNLPATRPPAVLGAGQPPVAGPSDREERSVAADRQLSRVVLILGTSVLGLGVLGAVGLALLWRPGRLARPKR